MHLTPAMWMNFYLYPVIFFSITPEDFVVYPPMEYVDLRFHMSDDVSCPMKGINQNSLSLQGAK
jgi:hypothetical protein